ncbi:alpha/beta hydrolase family protein [Pseudomonas cerasi]
MMRLIFCTLLWVLSLPAWCYSVGSRQETIVDSQNARTLAVRIFYPSFSEQAPQMQAANGVFSGFPAIANAPLAAGRFPLIVLSHGSGGNNTSLAWLAVPLAARGAIVIAANHPGSTTGNPSPKTDLTLQITDLSFMLTHYLQAPRWQQAIDGQNIGAIGHSKGGYSVLALAGARTNRQRMNHYCQTMPQMPDCQFYYRDGVRLENTDDQRLAASYHDPRVKWVIALDPGMSYVLTRSSLDAIQIPLQTIAAGYFIRATGKMTLGVDRLKLPLVTLPEAGHFDFLPLCQPDAAAILAEEGEAFICETPTADREAIHQQTLAIVSQFLQRHGFLTTQRAE